MTYELYSFRSYTIPTHIENGYKKSHDKLLELDSIKPYVQVIKPTHPNSEIRWS